MRPIDLQQLVQNRKQVIVGGLETIRDFGVFDFNHVPPEPVLRQEFQHLIDLFLRFEVTGIPGHVAIIGSRGSGKTLTMRLLERLLGQQTRLDIHYVNCREHSTSFKILAYLLGVQARGASLTELFARFTQQRRDRTVLILDEIDLMSQKDRRREILYLLSRSDPPVMVAMLSNNPHVLKELDAATRSSLQPQLLHFRNYDAGQIQAILEDRARRGLVTWPEGLLPQIAAMTVRNTNADARIAIKTLFYCVTERHEQVESCFERARRDLVVDLITDLSDANLMILRAAGQSRTDFAKEIYQRYCHHAVARHEKPFSYVHFYSNLSYLQSAGLLALISAKVARTYTNRIMLTFDPSVLDGVWRLRMEPGH